MSDGVGAVSHDRRGGRGAIASTVAHLPEGWQRRKGRAASSAGIADGPVLPGLHPVLRVFSRRYRPRRGGVAPVGVDVADRQTAHATGARLALAVRWPPRRSLEDTPMNDAPESPIKRSGDEWEKELPPETFSVMRKHGTERAGTSPLNKEHRPGMYACAACGLPLFESSTKFDSGTGWPSFFSPLPKPVGQTTDRSLGMARTEGPCARRGRTFGQLFPDRPQPP